MNHLKRNSTKSFKDSAKSFNTAILPDITYFNTNDFVDLTYDCNSNYEFDSNFSLGNISIGINNVGIKEISFVFSPSSASGGIFKKCRGNFKIILNKPFIMAETTKGGYYRVLKLKTLIKKLIIKLVYNDVDMR